MVQEGVDPSFIDKEPGEMIPEVEPVKKAVEMVAVSEHPKYVKFFKMMKVRNIMQLSECWFMISEIVCL
jgi:hypothetical protein